nr:asparagine synthase C-terminal domain-containing protein [Actinomycetota bacterium]
WRIERAVERQMVADVPVGVMLSGGIDSATLAAVMTRVGGRPVETFTVGFEGCFAQNELDAARATARILGTNHHDVVISAEGYAEWLPQSVWHMEEPVATSQTLPFFKVCQLAREHVTVVLTGQGADEPFAGYPRHLGERYGALYRRLPAGLRSAAIAPLVGRLPRNEQLKRAVLSLGEEDALARMRRVYSVMDPALERQLLGGGPVEADDPLGPWGDDVGALDDLNKMLYVDARTSLSDNLLLYGDKMSMAVSLEARVPYLDLELMALAESIPAELKIRRRAQKAILKKAMEQWLPPEIMRRKKIGFATPVDEWLRGELRDHLRERLLDRDSGCREHFDPATMKTMIDDHASGRHDHKRSLFALLTFEVWHDLFIRPSRWEPRDPVGSAEVPA